MQKSLSPDQFSSLISDDWSGNGPIRLNSYLPIESCIKSTLFTNAHIFLRHLIDNGPSKATATGNLSRKLVAELIDKMVWPDGYIDEVRYMNKVIDEINVFPLHVIRVLLEFSQIIRKYKGAWRVTKKFEYLVEDEHAGELFMILFYTHFRRFPLSYLDRLREETDFQHYVAYPLYVLWKMDRVWRSLPDLKGKLLLDHVLSEIHESAFIDRAEHLLDCQFIRPLRSFGLVEVRGVREIVAGDEAEYAAVRKTELYDEFFRVEF